MTGTGREDGGDGMTETGRADGGGRGDGMAGDRGLVAAGSAATAGIGVDILRRGGNAADAAVAAALGTAGGEPPLTSLAGGGVLLHHRADSGRVEICDFSPDTPGRGSGPPADGEFFPVELQFGPARQVFHIGRAAAAVPAGLEGLLAAHRRWGRLPLAELVEPVCRLLRRGIALDTFQQSCIDLLAPILLHSAGSRRVFTSGGRLLRAGDRARNPELADTLEQLAALGWRAFRERVWWPAVLADFGPRAGGLISEADLEAYRPDFRPPLARRYRGQQIFLPPAPAAGGALIGLTLALLERRPLGDSRRGSALHLRALLAAMRTVQRARASGGDPLQPAALERLGREFDRACAAPPTGQPPGPPAEGATTHISAVDAAGNAAAVTLSHGEGCGYAIGRTGIIMNNMLGEADLHPAGFHRSPPGRRLATMMSPSLIRAADGGLTVLGSGGANRIRTAIAQVVSNLIDFGLEPQAAVDAGRLHWESGVLNAELFDLPGGRSTIAAVHPADEQLLTFDRPHLFFGGVHLARRQADGRLDGGGDRRRSGAVERA